MDFPKEFNSVEYVQWHNETIPGDADLALKIDELLEEVKTTSINDVNLLKEMFQYFFKYAEQEFETSLKETAKYEAAEEVNYKSSSSLINKLWRNYKNKEKLIPVSEIKNEITDLIRTEIIGDTLTSCRFLAERFKIEHSTKKCNISLFDSDCVKSIVDKHPLNKEEEALYNNHFLNYVYFKE